MDSNNINSNTESFLVLVPQSQYLNLINQLEIFRNENQNQKAYIEK
jgi:hypothetical protein